VSEPTTERAADVRAERLAAFSAGSLDFDEVRALLERRTQTGLGRRAVAELAPVDDALAAARLARFDEFRSLEAVRDLPAIGGVVDPAPRLARARREGRALAGEELRELATFLASVERLSGWLRERVETAPRLCELREGLPSVRSLREELEACVDERGRVADDASPKLAALRREIVGLERTAERQARAIAQKPKLRPFLTDGQVHRRGGRTVLAVKAQSSGRVPGIVHDRSQSGETAFVEPRELVELQNRLAGARLDERAEVDRILVEATRRVLDAEPDFDAAAERLAELELGLIALAFARDFGARAPALVSAGDAAGGARGLVLRAARHPLLVQQECDGRLDEAVAIDVRLGDDFDLLIVTGPNTGGKTLAIKTVGLVALLVRTGFPIPCGEGSRVPLYDGICADIGDEQEVSQNLSTFASHLVRIRDGLARATPRTLVLLDELGGGTDPDEGAALGDAVLSALEARGVPTLATTHLGKLKEFAWRHARAENACVEFDVETLEPRYHLLIGTPGESSALVIARRLGLSDGLVRAAEERLSRRADEVQELIASVQGERERVERQRTELDERQLALEGERRELAGAQADLARRGEVLEAETRRDVESRVREARAGLDGLRALARQAPGAVQKELLARLDELERVLSGAAWSERRQAYLDGLSKGQFVYLPRLQKRCVIAKIDKKREQVTVRMGKVPVVVTFDELTAYEGL